MTDEPLNLSRRKALAALGTIGAASAGAGLGTSAYFSDQETFENNRLVAGTLDLKVAWQEHYSDWMDNDYGTDPPLGAETRFARMPDEGESPDISLPPGDGQTDARPIELVFVDDADGDDEDGFDSRPDEADGGRQFFRNTRRTEVNDGIYGGPDTLCGTESDTDSRVLIEIEDLKPGDFGFALFRLELCDNPGFLWLNGGLDGASENGRTEPERDDPDEETGTVELLDEVQVAYAVGTTNDIAAGPGANPLPLPQNGTLENQTTLRAFLNDLASEKGIGLAGDLPAEDGGGMGRNCFSGETSHYASVVWWLPIDHGNQVQSDTAQFDLGFYTEQCRHNDGAGATSASAPDGWAVDAQSEPTSLDEPGDEPRYGSAVDIGDGISAVGAPFEDHSVDAGSAYVDGQEFEPGSFVGSGESPLIEAGDEFGTAVAYDATPSGDKEFLAIGAPGDSPGRVYILTRVGDESGDWTLFDVVDGDQLSLADENGGEPSLDSDSNARFGAAVDIDATSRFVLVGAPGASGRNGAARLVELDASESSPEAFILERPPEAGEGFGTAVALEFGLDEFGGISILVGAPEAALGTEGPRAGAVYDYVRGPERPIKLRPFSGESGDAFGAAIDVYAGRLPIDGGEVVTPVVGAPGVDGGRGAAYVFSRVSDILEPMDGDVGATDFSVSGRLTETARLTADGGAFGSSVAAFRTPAETEGTFFALNVVVGAPNAGTGTASLFRAPVSTSGESGDPIGVFEELGTFTPGSGAAQFGNSVAYHGGSYGESDDGGDVLGTLLVGAPGSDGRRGRAVEFTRLDLDERGDGEDVSGAL